MMNTTAQKLNGNTVDELDPEIKTKNSVVETPKNQNKNVAETQLNDFISTVET